MTQNTTKKPACKEVGQPMQDRSRLRTDSRQCALEKQEAISEHARRCTDAGPAQTMRCYG